MRSMDRKKGFTLACVFAGLFALLLALVRMIDVEAIGPEGTEIGLSHLNAAVRDALGFHPLWYQITQALGMLAIGVAAAFALVGLVQLVRRGSFWRVDREIGALGFLYALVAALYVLFEVVTVNFRPVIMPGEEHVEASFPSSHTMLVCVVMGSAILLARRYLGGRGDGGKRAAAETLCVLVIALTVFGRLYAGVHWFTDILAGVLLSASLLSLYAGFIGKPRRGRARGSAAPSRGGIRT